MLETAWREITGEAIRLTASGRTDSGVHAEGQVAGVETTSAIACDKLVAALNAKLPQDVIVRSVDPAPDHFHATHDALQKTYRYQIHNSRVPPLFDRQLVWHVPTGELDVAAMQAASKSIVGRHDFACFESTGSARSTTVRTVIALTVTRCGERVDIEVTGDGFLYNMVRSIAGTLVEVGRGAQPAEWVAQVLASRDRTQAGQTAPACGLVLARVNYS